MSDLIRDKKVIIQEWQVTDKTVHNNVSCVQHPVHGGTNPSVVHVLQKWRLISRASLYISKTKGRTMLRVPLSLPHYNGAFISSAHLGLETDLRSVSGLRVTIQDHESCKSKNEHFFSFSFFTFFLELQFTLSDLCILQYRRSGVILYRAIAMCE